MHHQSFRDHIRELTPELGYELFRRAIRERDDDAWQALIRQYAGIVMAVVRRHPSARQLVEDDTYWINRTFEKLWYAVGPDRFDRFADIAALVAYLKMCAASVVLDTVRDRRAGRVESLDASEIPVGAVVRADVGERIVSDLTASALWNTVCGVLGDENLTLVARQSFVSDLSPRQILARYPGRFASISDVYRLKRRAIERLRASPEIRAYLS